MQSACFGHLPGCYKGIVAHVHKALLSGMPGLMRGALCLLNPAGLFGLCQFTDPPPGMYCFGIYSEGEESAVRRMQQKRVLSVTLFLVDTLTADSSLTLDVGSFPSKKVPSLEIFTLSKTNLLFGCACRGVESL